METDDYPQLLSQLAQEKGGPLVCHGCAHSAGSAPYPGRPSGERPCCFCTRNVRRLEWVERGRKAGLMEFWSEANYGKSWTAFYDNSPMSKCPMDCYISTDRVSNSVPPGSVAIT